MSVPEPGQVMLRAYEDARDIIRLLQCALCSRPVREPLTLPCGNSLCRSCLPPLHKRENITYPLTKGRAEGFACPFEHCSLEHSMGDCSTDVTLNKALDAAKACISNYNSDKTGVLLSLEVLPSGPRHSDSSLATVGRPKELHGGRLVATYLLADMGGLNYHSDLIYTPTGGASEDQIKELDAEALQKLRETIRSEVDCQVCYAVMLEPLTTSCGHTYCRKCVARVLDLSNLCPICRRELRLAAVVQNKPSNKMISRIIEGFLPDLLATRKDAAKLEDVIDEDAKVPLFRCTLAFPMMPLFLHIFEPRYQLMTTRVVENGTMRFGMVMHNMHRQPQGHLGLINFMQYGTLVHIERVEMLADGRFMLETRGTSRFKVLEASIIDGYSVGRIQRIDDLPLSEEEAIEARETGSAPLSEDNPGAQIEHQSTQQLLESCLEFVEQSRARSAPWLHQRILAIYGEPPTDPTVFPYWFACVLPIADDQKYTLLPTTSVRERLKIAAKWVQRLETDRWQTPSSCAVF